MVGRGNADARRRRIRAFAVITLALAGVFGVEVLSPVTGLYTLRLSSPLYAVLSGIYLGGVVMLTLIRAAPELFIHGVAGYAIVAVYRFFPPATASTLALPILLGQICAVFAQLCWTLFVDDDSESTLAPSTAPVALPMCAAGALGGEAETTVHLFHTLP